MDQSAVQEPSTWPWTTANGLMDFSWRALMVEIQVQVNGVWQTFSYIVNDPRFYLNEMRNAQASYPSHRVRTVDENGRLIDML